jgi:hypothetical protein
MLRKLSPLVILGLLVAGAQVASAQTTGNIGGTVKDETGGVLPGATVTATNTQTGLARETVTDADGRYRITNLNIGNYDVTAAMTGFQTIVRRGISLTIGREAVVDFSMSLGGLQEDVTVTGDAPLVDTRSGSMGDIVDRATILEIPLQGRDLTGLMTLQAGVTRGTADGESASNGWSNKFSVNGGRANDNAVMLDGTEVRSFDQGVPAGVTGNFMGSEAIQEFKVEKNSYSAEFGGAAGGVINVVSKSGGNAFHGSGYGFMRNDAMDATNFRAPAVFDDAGNFIGQEKPEFWRAQYGASAGGRIIQNKTFYFANWEGLRQELGRNPTVRMLTALGRQGIFPDRTVAVKPEMVPYLALWPLPGPNAVDLGDGTAREVIVSQEPTDEDFYQVRIDHNFSTSDSIFGRFSWQDSTRTTPSDIPTWGVSEFVKNRFLTVEHRKIFTSRLLGTVRFGYNRRALGSQGFEEEGAVDPSLHLIPESGWLAPLGSPRVMGEFSVENLSAVGLARGWVDRAVDKMQFTANTVYTRGANTLKVGVDFTRVRLHGDNPSRPGGNFFFDSIDALLQGLPVQFRGDWLPETDWYRDIRWNTIGSYAQYDWQLHERASLNLGLRHDMYTVPSEVDGKHANLKNPLTDPEITVLGTRGDAWWENPSLQNFAPRVGASWDPTGSGRTAVRGGVGLFYNLIQPEILRQSAYRTAPFALETNIQAPEGVIPFPTGLYEYVLSLGAEQAAIFPFPYFADEVGNFRMWQWNVNVQRQLNANTAVTIGYAGSRSMDTADRVNLNTAMAANVDGRLVFPSGIARPNPNFNIDLESNTNSGKASYHSLQIEGRRRFNAGWQLQMAYTWSKAMDYVSSAGPATITYVWDREVDWGLADHHAAHRFTTSFVWQMPGANAGGVLGAAFGGWQLGGILHLSAGDPATISMGSQSALSRLGVANFRPDLASGGDDNPVLGGPDVYFDASQFVLPPARALGNVQRNTLITPGIATVDIGLTKNVTFGARRIQFRVEAFNLLNRANMGNPTSNVMNGTGRPNANAGYIGSTSTPARQLQLGMRFEW